MPAPPPDEFQYAILRVVPDVERGECLNAGVVVFCRRRGYLRARVGLDERRLAAVAGDADAAGVARHLEELVRIAAGDPGAGAIAALPQSERFHWLAAPSSTVVQPSPVHTGFCEDPEQMLAHLFERLVT
jgi:Protein of unknown function (DUF3037)